MFEFAQSVIERSFTGNNGHISSSVKAYSGKRIMDGKRIYLKTCEDMQPKFNYNKNKLNYIIDYLQSLYPRLKQLNINFTFIIKVHNEIIGIDRNTLDERKFSYCRIALRDSYSNVFADEFSLEYDIEELIKDINFIVDKCNILNENNSSQKGESLQLPVVFSPSATGYFTHEIIGHILEEDIYNYTNIQSSNLKFDKRLIIKDSIEKFRGLCGMGKYDDAGTFIKPILLVSDGKIRNTIAINKEASLDNHLYGMARRQSYKFSVLPRMRCTFIMPNGSLSQEQIIEKYHHAFYLDKVYAGNLQPLSKEYTIIGIGSYINKGEIEDKLYTVQYNGNLENDLNNVELIGNDFSVSPSYCVKGDQIVRVCMGGPTISIKYGKIVI